MDPLPEDYVDEVIELKEVSKRFGDLVAVSNVSFTIGMGITALVGPNGAGKSTIIRMVCGMTSASRGDIRVLGQSPRSKSELFGRIGLVPQHDGLLEPLSGKQFVGLASQLHGTGDPANWMEKVGLDPDDDRPIRTYSKGMRQRIKVAQALAGNPEVLILDEPLNGLDPRGRREMIALFRQIADQGKTVLVSSHVLSEVELMGSRVLVLVQGKLAAEGDFREIRKLLDDRPHRVLVRCSDPAKMAGALLEGDVVQGVSLEHDDSLLVITSDASKFRRSVVSIAQKRDVHLLEVAPLDDDLESVFRYLVGAE